MQIAAKTTEMTHDEWLEFRKNGIGGSDAAACCGLDKWKSPIALYLEKIGTIENDVDSEAAYFGNVLEDVVAKEFEKRTGKRVRRMNQILQHPEYPFMLANIDRKVVGEDAVLECKTTNEYNKKEWTDDEVPEKYVVQVQHYLAVTGYSKAYFAVLIGGQKFKWYEMPRDEELIKDITEMEKEFWKCVETRTPPEIDGTESSKKVLDIIFPPDDTKPEKKELEGDTGMLLDDYEDIKEQISQLEEQKQEIENKLKNRLGEYEEGQFGDTLITWKPIVSKRFNSKAFKSEYPDLYEQFRKESSYRRFMIKRGE
jgi:putative phage-type endonuclease